MDLILARVELQTLKPQEVLDIVKKCPYMLNAFRLSGASNISILIVSNHISDLDRIINHHFRSNPDVSSVQLDIITDVVNDFVLPFDFNFAKCGNTENGECCGACNKFELI